MASSELGDGPLPYANMTLPAYYHDARCEVTDEDSSASDTFEHDERVAVAIE